MTRKRRTPQSAEAPELLHYTLCGLDDVWLLNGFRHEQTPDGPALRIEDADGLHRAIARALVTEKRPLGGREMRYLRKLLRLSQSGLGRLVGLSEQTVARWEKAETTVDPASDRLVRFIVREFLGDEVVVREELQALAERDEALHGAHRLRHAGGAWARAA